MAGVTSALQTPAPLGQELQRADRRYVAGRNGQSEQYPDCRPVHDSENQAAQYPNCRKTHVLHALSLALQCCTPAIVR